jgi:hypothetical protein
MKKCYLIALSCILIFVNSCFSQVEFKLIAQNRIIQKHFNEVSLRKIEVADANRLQTLYSYFTQSFVYTVDTDEDISIKTLLDVFHFDISEFESLRIQSANYTFKFKEKFSITLYSKDYLTSLLNGYDRLDLISKLPARTFPLFVSTGNMNLDFQNYKKLVWDWAKDFPQEYQEYCSTESVIHIRITDFSSMSTEKRALVTASGNYLLID